MTINKEFLDRDTNIKAKIICDSIHEGKRITTFELEYHRFIHAELLTHRMFSRNCSSSRAIPLKRMLETTENNLAVPIYYGANKQGMQATEEIEQVDKAKELWQEAFKSASSYAVKLGELGLHKQIPNRLVEPFQIIKVVVTSTDFENFFNLRIHKDAQPEILILANKMYEAYIASEPLELDLDEYHLPYIERERLEDGILSYYTVDVDNSDSETNGYEYKNTLSSEEAVTLSVASCAAVSYRTDSMTFDKAVKIFTMLLKADVAHGSPLEHIAKPMQDQAYLPEWEEGITHVDKWGNYFSGNLKGWIQFRQLVEGHVCNEFDYAERMKSF